MGTKFRIEVTEDSNANGVTHGVIVLERVVGAGENKSKNKNNSKRQRTRVSAPHMLDQMRYFEKEEEAEQG